MSDYKLEKRELMVQVPYDTCGRCGVTVACSLYELRTGRNGDLDGVWSPPGYGHLVGWGSISWPGTASGRMDLCPACVVVVVDFIESKRT